MTECEKNRGGDALAVGSGGERLFDWVDDKDDRPCRRRCRPKVIKEKDEPQVNRMRVWDLPSAQFSHFCRTRRPRRRQCIDERLVVHE